MQNVLTLDFEEVGMLKKVLVAASFLGFCLMLSPVDSCDTYVFNYENSRAFDMGGFPVCADYGPGCVESGSCSGGSHCVDDGVRRLCNTQQKP